MNINEKVKKFKNSKKNKYFVLSERPIYAPELLKSGLNVSMWSYKENKPSLVFVIFL